MTEAVDTVLPHFAHLHAARIEVDHFEDLVLRPRLEVALAIFNGQKVVKDGVSGR